MTISEAILATLRYSDHFDFPLTQKEIFTRLVKTRLKAQNILTDSLTKLVKQKNIGQTQKYYYLHGRKSLVSRRLKKEAESLPMLHLARKLVSKIATFSGVLAIYLTGSLAVKNSDREGDIDLMVITHPGKLWTTRLMLTIYLTLFGLRRTPAGTHVSGKLCLNLYLTPESYLVPTSRHTLYTAYELIQAVPLYDPAGTHRDLLASNSWISDYLPNFPLPKTFTPTREHSKTGVLENVLYYLQFAYMKNKITREYVTKDSAYFHPKNPGNSVLKKLSL